MTDTTSITPTTSVLAEMLPASLTPAEKEEKLFARLSEIDEAEAVALADKTKFATADDIIGFGAEAQATTAELTSTVLSKFRTSDVAIIGTQIKKMIETTNSLDLSMLDGYKPEWYTKIWPVNMWLDKAQRFMSDFDSVDRSIKKQTDVLVRQSYSLKVANGQIRLMEQLNAVELRNLLLHIRAGEILHARMKEDSAKNAARLELNDMDGQRLQQELDGKVTNMSIRLGDLRVVAVSTFIDIPVFSQMLRANSALDMKIATLATTGMAMYRKKVFQVILAMQAGQIAALIDHTIGYMNEMARSSADAINDAMLKAEHAVQQPILSTETIVYVKNARIALLSSLALEQENGEKARQDAIPVLQGVVVEMNNTMNKQPKQLAEDARAKVQRALDNRRSSLGIAA